MAAGADVVIKAVVAALGVGALWTGALLLILTARREPRTTRTNTNKGKI